MARAICTGVISFGLVAIPIKVYTAASPDQVRFNMITPSGNRVKQNYVDAITGDTVARDECSSGYEYAKGEYVVFSKEELSKLDSERTNSMEITEFVEESSIDPLQVEKTYYLGPNKGGDKPYALLSQSLSKLKRIGLAQWNVRGRDNLVAIRSYKDGLIMHQLYYTNEVRNWEVDVAKFTFSPAEEKLAAQLINQLTYKKLDLSKYKDHYNERVMAAVNEKISGREITTSLPNVKATVVDIFEALKKSLEDLNKAK